MLPPKDAPHIAPKPNMDFCNAWYIPRFLNGIMSELMIVALLISSHHSHTVVSLTHRHQPASSKSCQRPHHINQDDVARKSTSQTSIANVIVDTKKHTRRPKISLNLPYSGWKAVLVIRYDVVNQEAVLAASNSEDITA
jgi:hypothetical protein